MVFLIPKNGKLVIHNKVVLNIASGEYDTKDKGLQETLSKCKGVTVVKKK